MTSRDFTPVRGARASQRFLALVSLCALLGAGALIAPSVRAQPTVTRRAFNWSTSRPTVTAATGTATAEGAPATEIVRDAWYRWSTPSAAVFSTPYGRVRATGLREIRFSGDTYGEISMNAEASLVVEGTLTAVPLRVRFGFVTVDLFHRDEPPVSNDTISLVIRRDGDRTHVVTSTAYSNLEVTNHNTNQRVTYLRRELPDFHRVVTIQGNTSSRDRRSPTQTAADAQPTLSGTATPLDHMQYVAAANDSREVVATVVSASRREGSPAGAEMWSGRPLHAGERVIPETHVLVVCRNGGQVRVGGRVAVTVQPDCRVTVGGSGGPTSLTAGGIVEFRGPAASSASMSVGSSQGTYEGRGSGRFGFGPRGVYVAADSGALVLGAQRVELQGNAPSARSGMGVAPTLGTADANRSWWLGLFSGAPTPQGQPQFFPEAQQGTAFLSGGALIPYTGGVPVISPPARTPVRRLTR